MSRHRVSRRALFVAWFAGSCLNALGSAGAQQPPKADPPRAAPAPFDDDREAAIAKARKELESTLEKMFDGYDLKPSPLPAVPDNPPPHESAMIDYPLVIEPPDLIIVEVLEALPGRPISGERLVRPDGNIDLGFYGEVHVAGLTPIQAKVKIIKHLRKRLTDEILGIEEFNFEDNEQAIPEPPKAHEPPKDAKPLVPEERKQPGNDADKPRTVPSGFKVRSVGQGTNRAVPRFARPTQRVRLIGRTQDQDEKKAEEAQKEVKIPFEAGGQVTITIEVRSQDKAKEQENELEFGAAEPMPGKPIHPAESDHVFVDITAHNSKNYFVLGDVANPGRLPFTGRETVMDALNYAGGLLPTAEPKDIRLVRPARGGKPAKVYKVDLEAIQERGDVSSNYQIFPGDRLVVGRNEVVKKTIELDRLAAPLHTVVNEILQESTTLRSLKTTSPDDHEAILKGLVEFWIQELKRPEGAKFDEQTLREALLRRLQIKPEKPSERK